jgi:hypothetical protein
MLKESAPQKGRIGLNRGLWEGPCGVKTHSALSLGVDSLGGWVTWGRSYTVPLPLVLIVGGRWVFCIPFTHSPSVLVTLKPCLCPPRFSLSPRQSTRCCKYVDLVFQICSTMFLDLGLSYY